MVSHERRSQWNCYINATAILTRVDALLSEEEYVAAEKRFAHFR